MSNAPDLGSLLLPGRDPATFFAAHWGKSWVHMRGAPDHFAEIFVPTDLGLHAVGDIAAAAPAPSLSFTALGYTADGAPRMFGAPLEMAKALLAAGMTLRFTELELTHPKIASFVAAAATFLGVRGRPPTVTSFVSPEKHGFPWHFDSPHVFVMQIDGSKRWQLGRQRVHSPAFLMEAEGTQAANTAALLKQLGMTIGDPPADTDCDEIILEPGDVLYMPPGIWHRAFAIGKSIHLSVLDRPATFGKLLRALVTVLGLRHESWREDTTFLAPEALHAFIGQRLEEAQRSLAATTPANLLKLVELLATSPLARLTILDKACDVL